MRAGAGFDRDEEADMGLGLIPARAPQTSESGTIANPEPVAVGAPRLWTPPPGVPQMVGNPPRGPSHWAISANVTGSLVVPTFRLPKSKLVLSQFSVAFAAGTATASIVPPSSTAHTALLKVRLTFPLPCLAFVAAGLDWAGGRRITLFRWVTHAHR